MVEQGDIASATSQWSTKLIHGGLRYLEQYEFRLVRESLAEREVVLRQAPHIVEPLSFVLPHEPHLRPAWMLRAGLFMYDHLGRRETLPGSFGVDLSRTPWGAGLKPKFGKGFVYSDARVDDARLVVFNVMDASLRGARVLVRTTLMSARRERDASGPFWSATLRDVSGVTTDVTAKVLVNAAGPWVKRVRDTINDAAVERGRPPHQGQPHRGSARARRRARLHPAERRQAHRLRDSVSGALHADRDHGCAGRQLRATRDLGRRNRLPAGARQHLPRATARQSRRGLDLQRRASAVRRRRVGSVVDHARLCVQARYRRQRRRGRAVHLWRQDHHVSEARRARARRVDAVPAADAAALDGTRDPSRRRPAGRSGRLERGAHPALSGAPGERVAQPRAPARDACAAGPGRREEARRSRRGFRPRAVRSGDRLRRARGVGARGRGRALAPDQVRHRHVRGRAQPRRGLRDEVVAAAA